MFLALALFGAGLAAEPAVCAANLDPSTGSVVVLQVDGRPIAQLEPDQQACYRTTPGAHDVRLVRVLVTGAPPGSKVSQALVGHLHYAAQLAHILRRHVTNGDRDLQLGYEVRAAVGSGAWDSADIVTRHQLDQRTLNFAAGETIALEVRGGAELSVTVQDTAWWRRRASGLDAGWTEHPEAWLLFKLADGARHAGYPELLTALGLQPLFVEPSLDELLDGEGSESLPEH
jgi:hypothetical protein